jgi:ATP-dependent DNA helicase RecQ
VAGTVRELLGDQPARPGQTLVYHVISRLLHGTTVVVSPTIALQADQVAALREREPDAVTLTLNSALTQGATRRAPRCLPRTGELPAADARRYAETTTCRRRLILELLGEPAYEPCGNCDNCDAGHGGRVDDVPFAIGSSVSHAEWGTGTVEQYEEDRITLRFDRSGFKTLALDVAMDRGLLSTLDRR